MKQQEVKYYYTSDVDNFDSAKVASLEDFYFPLQVNIGPINEHASDIFNIMVISPSRLSSDVIETNDKVIVIPVFDVSIIKNIRG